jgi:hypothetical protein
MSACEHLPAIKANWIPLLFGILDVQITTWRPVFLCFPQLDSILNRPQLLPCILFAVYQSHIMPYFIPYKLGGCRGVIKWTKNQSTQFHQQEKLYSRDSVAQNACNCLHIINESHKLNKDKSVVLCSPWAARCLGKWAEELHSLITRYRHHYWTQPGAYSSQFSSSYPISLMPILISFSYLCLPLPYSVYVRRFPTKLLLEFLVSPMCALLLVPFVQVRMIYVDKNIRRWVIYCDMYAWGVDVTW